MSSVQEAIVAELRRRTFPHMSDLRRALGLTAAEVAAGVQSLRYQGKMLWDRLELSSSMLAGDEPAPGTVAAPIAAEGGVAAAKQTSPPSNLTGPDDEDDEDYPGGVNDRAEEAVEGPPGIRSLSGEGQAGDGAERLRPEQPALPERGVEEFEPDRADDQRESAEQGGQAARPRGAAGAAVEGSFVPKHLLHRAGVHAANTRAAGKPLPAPEHEPEIARLVREEVNEGVDRRARARSTATVRQPLEVRKFGIPDLNLSEAIGCMLTDEPVDVLRAVSRKHPAIWRRCVLLARIRGERPIQTLYAALERGLDQLDQAEREAA